MDSISDALQLFFGWIPIRSVVIHRFLAMFLTRCNAYVNIDLMSCVQL
ncbi:MAG: hypothetical protein KatS3mg049_2889 [Caldilinea sp.]|jgi:hypothetical protein|nr:MAG: hypothetical protein KatS3mg049_2889 [Caldilinea sp.]